MTDKESEKELKDQIAKEIAEIIKLTNDTDLVVPIPNNARRFAERIETVFF